jgi:hypothetical protein
MILHLQLKAQIEKHFSAYLNREIVMKQDALQFSLTNGVDVEIRYFDPCEYSVRWVWGEAGLRIDTAPLHHDLKTTPNHLHDMDGQVVNDPLTVHGAEPWSNVCAVLNAVIKNPALI